MIFDVVLTLVLDPPSCPACQNYQNVKSLNMIYTKQEHIIFGLTNFKDAKGQDLNL